MLPITLVSQYKLELKNPILEQRGKFWDKPTIFPDNTDNNSRTVPGFPGCL